MDIEFFLNGLLRDIGFEYQSTSDTKVYTTKRVYKSGFNRSLTFGIPLLNGVTHNLDQAKLRWLNAWNYVAVKSIYDRISQGQGFRRIHIFIDI